MNKLDKTGSHGHSCGCGEKTHHPESPVNPATDSITRDHADRYVECSHSYDEGL